MPDCQVDNGSLASNRCSVIDTVNEWDLVCHQRTKSPIQS